MKLRLGPLPRTEVVKLAITIPIQLKEQLDRYAAVHSQTYGESVDATTLIPHMLAQFVARDHAFRAAGSSRARNSTITTACELPHTYKS